MADEKKEHKATLSLGKASDIEMSAMYLNILVSGMSGAGKTYFATSSPGVAVALLEAQGFATIREEHPDTLVPGPEGDDGVPCLRTMDQFREFVLMAARGILRDHGVHTLVIDSGTELQRMIMDEILAEKRKAKAKSAGSFTKQDWGTLAQRQRAILRTLRDLPYNVVFITLVDWTVDEETSQRRLTPLMKGGIQKELAGYFHASAYLYRRQTSRDSVKRYAMLDGDERYPCKPFGKLSGILRPDLAAWLDVALGDGDPASIQVEDALYPSDAPGARSSGGPRFGDGDDENEDEDE